MADEIAPDVAGQPLEEALRRYVGDQATWEACDAAWRRVPKRPPPMMSSVGAELHLERGQPLPMSQGAYRELVRAYARLRDPLEKEFRAKLVSGELVGVGYVHPYQHGASAVPIGVSRDPTHRRCAKGSNIDHHSYENCRVHRQCRCVV